ncbi:MAG: pyridoxamine 5'-phosphate oxidase family protein [Acidimicrobiales bacterium]
MTLQVVGSEKELRDIIKAPPATVTGKIRSGPLRGSASQYLAMVRLGVVAMMTRDDSPRTFTVGGEAGFVTQDPSSGVLIVPLPASHRGELAGGRPQAGFAGLLLMVPGVKYTLRVNGAVAVSEDGETLRLTPDQSYAHCAKAFIRSGLWDGDVAPTAGIDGAVVGDGPQDHLDDVAIEFIGSSPFATLGTSLADGDVDVSPRGDPPGFVQVVGRRKLFIPERPGNRIADSLRNIIANPTASVLFMLPGDPRVLAVTGQAAITTDTQLCAAAEINGKTPKLGVVIEVATAAMDFEPALAASDAWSPTAHVSESDLPTIGAQVADPRAARSLGKRALAGLADQAVKFDYKRNLY